MIGRERWTVIPPFRGELGLMIRYHVPAVRALVRPVAVCCEEGMEALYPDCERIIVTVRPDRDRRETYQSDRDYVKKWTKLLLRRHPRAQVLQPDKMTPAATERWFAPEPFRPQIGVQDIDVVICPRKRDYGPNKNWEGWQVVGQMLEQAGLRVFAAGAATSSEIGVPCQDAAWHYPRPLDASIEAMKRARLTIATCSGLAMLTVLCGTPLLMVTYHGLVAPGVVRNIAGKTTFDEYWPIPMDRLFIPINHLGVAIRPFDAWEEPETVANYGALLLGQQDEPCRQLITQTG